MFSGQSFRHSFLNGLWAFIDIKIFGLTHRTPDEVELVFSSRVLFFLVLVVLFSAPWLVMYFFGQGKPYSSFFLGFGSAFLLVSVWTLRKSRSSLVTGYLVGGVLVISMFVSAWENGGFAALASGINNLIPLFASLISNRAGPGFVFAAVIAAGTVVFFIQFPPPFMGPDFVRIWDAMLISYVCQPFLAAVASFAALLQRNSIVKATKTASDVRMKCLANLSHDLRTPLNAALGISAILGGSEMSDGQRELLESLESQQLALMDVINDILTVSAIEADVLVPLRPVHQPLTEVLNRVFSSVRYSASDQGIALLVYPPRADWAEQTAVLIDPARVFQVLLNLVGNAIKFCTRGGRVLLDARVLEERGGERARVVLVVQVFFFPSLFSLHKTSHKDTGCGMSKEVVEQLQISPRRFSQHNLSLGHLGSGLGLSIVSGLCKRMGYSLHFESELGSGTTVEIAFSTPVIRSPRPARRFDEIRLIGLTDVTNLDLSHLPFVAKTRWNIPIVDEPIEGSWGNERSLCIASCTAKVPADKSHSTVVVCRDPLCSKTVDCISHCVLVRRGSPLLVLIFLTQKNKPLNIFTILSMLESAVPIPKRPSADRRRRRSNFSHPKVSFVLPGRPLFFFYK
jgi:signal transduction histidine kinase